MVSGAASARYLPYEKQFYVGNQQSPYRREAALARQQRLERYARQHDQITGIVVYDGECYNHIEGDFCHQHTNFKPQVYSPQPEDSSDAFDQRLPEVWQDSQWDQIAELWQNTPLAQWANEGNVGDGIDPIPPEVEPVFITE